MKLVKKPDGRYYWKGRCLDLKIRWRGADTEIESAVYDDEQGGEVSEADWDALNRALVSGPATEMRQ